MIGRVNTMGGGIKGMPEFTYTGAYSLIDDGNGNWRVKFLSSGTLIFSEFGTGNGSVDVFCVGGGGGSRYAYDAYGNVHYGSGGAGYTATARSIVCNKDVNYTITIGGAGANSSGGGTSASGGVTSISGDGLTLSANGGGGGSSSQTSHSGGNGGSGGGASVNGGWGTGGTDGNNGNSGAGQGTTTREFGENTGDLYATGGGGNISAVIANSGNGGCGFSAASGIVIVRNHRS